MFFGEDIFYLMDPSILDRIFSQLDSNFCDPVSDFEESEKSSFGNSIFLNI